MLLYDSCLISLPGCHGEAFCLLLKGGDRMDAAAHTHELFYDHWLDPMPIERSSRLRDDVRLTS